MSAARPIDWSDLVDRFIQLEFDFQGGASDGAALSRSSLPALPRGAVSSDLSSLAAPPPAPSRPRPPPSNSGARGAKGLGQPRQDCGHG
jgi:hypothetical protein